MNDFLQILISAPFIYAVFRVTTPILFASLGAMISDRAGVINIGLEGMMLIGALAGVLGSWATNSVILGLAIALFASMSMAAIMAYFALNLKTNIIITGIAINLLAAGLSVFLLYIFTGNKGVSSSIVSLTVPSLDIPIIESIPFFGAILSGHNILTYLAFLFVLGTYIILFKTRFGIRLRAVGENAKSAQSVGINVGFYQYSALIISGLLAGFGGAYMSMGYVSWFSAGMTSGRGFIALAASAMGRATPLGTMLSALFFGFTDNLSNLLQTYNFPPEFVRMLPYLATIIGLTLYSISLKKRVQKGAK